MKRAARDRERIKKLESINSELLEALISASSFLPPNSTDKNDVGNIILKAIAKATGELNKVPRARVPSSDGSGRGEGPDGE